MADRVKKKATARQSTDAKRASKTWLKMIVMTLRLKVECYAGYKADERPLRFIPLTPLARTFEVRQVLDQWYGAGYTCFKVLADDGNLYILRHDNAEDIWTLDSFRRAHQESGDVKQPLHDKPRRT
ncbi:MAG: hypothetical protein LAP13_00305 [Acidobacteriia bacterium]|nr:hypothetical protein [Terriglobia bacterium]